MAKGFLKRRVFSFLEKPVSLDELEQNMSEALGIARALAAHERRSVRSFGDFEVDIVKRQVRAEDRQIPLTPIEFELISFLTSRPGEVLTRQMIYSKIWGDVSLSKNVLDTHLMNLRKKVPGFAVRLTSVYGVGFSFN